MENISFEFSIYVGKVGVDNLLLMIVGVLFLVLYILKRQEARYDRLNIYLYSSFFFLVYGFCYDIYRLKALRKYLIINYSFAPYHTIILLASLLPLYFCLVESLIRLIFKRFRKNS